MKALDSIEFYKLPILRKLEYLHFIGLYNQNKVNEYKELIEISELRTDGWRWSYQDNMVNDYHNFLATFRPELIEQLFDGWIINRLSQYANSDCRIDIHKNHIEYNNGYKLFYFIIPTTLNDFISDCSRSGIELIFKEAK